MADVCEFHQYAGVRWHTLGVGLAYVVYVKRTLTKLAYALFYAEAEISVEHHSKFWAYADVFFIG